MRRCSLMPQARWTHTGTNKKAKPGNSALIGWEEKVEKEAERETRDQINSRGRGLMEARGIEYLRKKRRPPSLT